MNINDTIVALSTAPGAAAIAVMRLSGDKAVSIAEEVFKSRFGKQLSKLYIKNGIDTDAPFPFLIEGTAKSFDWHVINWKDGDTEHSHEKNISSGLHGTLKKKQVEMLGFYSNAHHAIFTHHTTNMHIHVKTTDNKIAGHVDALTLGKGMLLKLPAKN